jgi:hypothetical protein
MTDFLSGRLKVCCWVKKWLLGVLVNTDLFIIWCWLRPLAMDDSQLYRVSSLGTNLCDTL